MVDSINNTVALGKGTLWEATPSLRFVERAIHGIDDGFYGSPQKIRILQQAHICREEGLVEWRDIPLEAE